MTVYGHIYAITHLPTGRYYIGQTRSRPLQRWSSHLCNAKKPKAHCIIDRVIHKHGSEQFAFEILASAQDKEQLNHLEKLWIIATASRTKPLGLNARHGGDGGGIFSLESRKKMSIAAKLRVANDPNWADKNRRIVKECKGKKRNPYSEESRKNFSIGQMRRHLANPEHLANQGKLNSQRLRNNWASLTEEQRELRLAPMKAARWR